MNAVIEAINQAGRTWWPYVFHATWTSSFVALLLLLVVKFGRRWPAQLRYGIILIALMKFAIPPTLAVPVGLFSRFGPTVVQEAEMSLVHNEELTAWAKLNWQSQLMLLHTLGSLAAAICILYQLAKLAKMTHRAHSVSSGPYYELFSRLSRQLGLRRSVRLLVSSEPVPPIAFGLLRPKVLVPVSVLRDLSTEQRRTILAHELAHHRRADLWINSLQILLGMLWWFNPFVRLLNRVLRQIREDCCDDLLLCRNVTTNDTYCQALLTIASDLSRTARLSAAMAFAQPLHPLAGRIRRIMDPGLLRLSRLSLKTIAAMSLLAVLLLPGLSSKPPVSPETNHQVLTSTDAMPATAESRQIPDRPTLAELLHVPGHRAELSAKSTPPVLNASAGAYTTALLNPPAVLANRMNQLAIGSGGKLPSSPSGLLVLQLTAENSDRASARPDPLAHNPLSWYVDGLSAIDLPGFGTATHLAIDGLASFFDRPQDQASDDYSQEPGLDFFADDSEDLAPEPFSLPKPDAPNSPEDNHRSPIYAGDSPDLRPEPLRAPTPGVPGAPDRHEQRFQRFAEKQPLDKLFRTQPYVLAKQTKLLDSIVHRKTASTLAALRSSDVASSTRPDISLVMADFAETPLIDLESPSDSDMSSSVMDIAEVQPLFDVQSPPDALALLDRASGNISVDSPEVLDLAQANNTFDTADIYESLPALETASVNELITNVSTVRRIDATTSVIAAVSPNVTAWQEPVDLADTFALGKAPISADAPGLTWDPAPIYGIIAVPEPLTAGLLLVGISMLLIARKRPR